MSRLYQLSTDPPTCGRLIKRAGMRITRGPYGPGAYLRCTHLPLAPALAEAFDSMESSEAVLERGNVAPTLAGQVLDVGARGDTCALVHVCLPDLFVLSRQRTEEVRGGRVVYTPIVIDGSSPNMWEAHMVGIELVHGEWVFSEDETTTLCNELLVNLAPGAGFGIQFGEYRAELDWDGRELVSMVRRRTVPASKRPLTHKLPLEGVVVSG